MAFGDFVVEDGTGLSDATSYATIDELVSYCKTHQAYNPVLASMDNDARRSALMFGAVWLDETWEWLGRVFRYGYTDNEQPQALRFPRTDVWDNEGRLLTPFNSEADSCPVPDRIKQANCEAALMHAASAVNAFDSAGQITQGPIEKITVDVIEIAYTNATSIGLAAHNPDKAGSRVKYIGKLVAPYVVRGGLYR